MVLVLVVVVAPPVDGVAFWDLSNRRCILSPGRMGVVASVIIIYLDLMGVFICPLHQ